MNTHRGAEVLRLLVGDYGWSIHGEDFDSIIYDEGVRPITKKQFEDGLANLDNLLAAEKAAKDAKRQEILDRLGISTEEVKLLLS